MVVLIRRGSVYNRDVFLFLTSRLASICGLHRRRIEEKGGGGGLGINKGLYCSDSNKIERR